MIQIAQFKTSIICYLVILCTCYIKATAGITFPSPLISSVTSGKGSRIVHTSSSTIHSSLDNRMTDAFFTARVEMMASLDCRNLFNFPYVEFHLVMQSCLSHNSAIPICLWLAFSFSAPKVLLWKQSTASLTLSRMSFWPLRAYQVIKFIVWARQGRWVHFCSIVLSSLPSNLLLLQLAFHLAVLPFAGW